jgi:hypothetical protein
MQNKENKTTKSSDKTEHKIAAKKTFLKGLTMADKADFYWIYQGLEFQMEFLAGFVGVKQDKETLELRPETGWAIRDTGKQEIRDDDANYKNEILNPFEPVLPK